jgi:predicted glycosyltransferase
MDVLVAWNLIKWRPRVLLGTYTPILSRYSGVPVISCNEDDADVVPRFVRLSYPYAKDILVPTVCDCGKWNQKSIKYNSYHELAYLHPKNFTPVKTVVEKYFNADLPYCTIRFAKLNAHHDGGIKGITVEIAQKMIDMLQPHMRIFITSERPLEQALEPYRIKIDPIDMHHVMAFASLYIGDSQTMAAEAGVLGVPFVRYNDFVGRIGYLRELEENYHLGYGIKTNETERLYKTIEELISMPDRKSVYLKRRQRMLSEKIDYAAFLYWFVENYPESRDVMKNNPDYQYTFK